MENNSWRAAQGQLAQGQGGTGEALAMPNAANAVAATTMDNIDWRTELQADSRQRIVNKIMDTLKRHLPFSGQDGLQELKKIAVQFEEKIYAAATSQSDYLRKISLKMLTMETNSQNPMANSNANKNPPDSVGHMHSQIHNQPLSVSVMNNPSQARQQLLAQNMQNTITSTGGQNSASLTSTIPSVGNLTQASMPNVIGQNNLQNMPNISTVAQNPVGNSMGQGMPPSVFANSQRQMPGRQQAVPHQQQQQSTSSQLLYKQQQLQQQYIKQKLQQGSIQDSLMQSHIQQQQQQIQQNLLRLAQLQTSQKAVMQPSVMQSTSLSNLQQNQNNISNLQQQQLMGQQNNLSNIQQMMSQVQSQNGQLQDLQQQLNPMQRDIQQRLQSLAALLQHQNVVEQQEKLFQSQQAILGASSTSLDSTAQTGNASGGDWQEEVYQKIKAMKEKYFTELNEMNLKIAARLQQQESLSQQTKNDQFDKLKNFKVTLDRLLQFLQLNKNDIQIGYKDKLGSVEKQVVTILNSHRPRKALSLQQGQHPQPHMQQPQAQPQIPQMLAHENQMNPQMQSMNVASSVATMQQNNLSGLQHYSLSSVPALSNSQQNMINAMQPASNSDGGQSNALNSLQQVAMSSLQQNPVSGPQSVNISSLTSHSGMNTLQSNLNNLQSNSAMLQNQHLKQQEQQMLQSQQLKQLMQQQLLHLQQLMLMQQQFLYVQQLMQQQQQQQPQQQTKQPLQPAQLPGHPMSPFHQMTDSSDMKMRQQMGVKPGVLQQQLKPGAPFSMTSPQVLQAASPQVPQHHSLQIDQQNMLSSITKSGTPLQSANSPFASVAPIIIIIIIMTFFWLLQTPPL